VYENVTKRKNEKEAKTSKRKRIKRNSRTICKETKINIRSVLQFVKSISSEVKRSEKNVYFVSLRSETKKSAAKRSERKNFWKRNKAKIRCIDFALVGGEKFEVKRNEIVRDHLEQFTVFY
jgi:hypothetical protein